MQSDFVVDFSLLFVLEGDESFEFHTAQFRHHGGDSGQTLTKRPVDLTARAPDVLRVFRNPDERITLVSGKIGDDVRPGTYQAILRQTGVNLDPAVEIPFEA